MAFLRSSLLFKNLLTNINHGTSYFVTRKMGETSVICNAIKRCYATATIPMAKQLSLEQKLKNLSEFSRKANYVSTINAKDLLDTLIAENASALQYYHCFKFFGEMMSDELPANRIRLIQKLWDSLQKNHSIEIAHYNALLNVYVENEHPIYLEEVINELETKNLQPNLITYQHILKSGAQKGDIVAVQRTLNFLQDEGIRRNTAIFTSLILAHAIAGDKAAALNYFNEMIDHGCDPTIETNVIVLRIHAMEGDVEAILSQIKRWKIGDVILQDKHILQVIYQLAISGHGSRCKELFGLLVKSGYYTRLAANTINRLIEAKQDIVAFELLRTLPQKQSGFGKNPSSGGFILEKLLNSNRSSEDIIAFCQRLQDENLHLNPFNVVLQKLGDASLIDQIWELLREFKARGMPLTEQNFRGAFNTNSAHKIRDGLNEMIRDFGISPSTEFLRKIVIPQLNIENPVDAINLLLTCNVSPTKAAAGIAYHCLQNNQLKDAANIISLFKIHIPVKLCQPALISAVRSKDDVESYVQFLHVYCHNLSKSYEMEIDINSADRHEVIGAILCETLAKIELSQRAEFFGDILKGLIEHGVTITSKQSNRIKIGLGEFLTTELEANLLKLSSNELELNSIKQLSARNLGIVSTSDHLEKKIVFLNGEEKINSQIELLKALYREGEIAKFEQSIQQFESENIQIPATVYALLIKSKADAGDAVAAVELYTKYKAQHNDLILQNNTIINIMALLIESGQIDVALDFSAKTKRINQIEQRFAEHSVSRLLHKLAQEGKVSEVKDIFNSLVDNGHVVIKNNLLGALVNVHLVNRDLEKAVETFEYLANRYKQTPFKNSLMKCLILDDDMERLDKVVSISSTVHRENSCLVDLLFGYIDCGRVQLAHTLLQNPHLHIPQERLKEQCQIYTQNGSIKELEDFIEASNDTTLVNRELIFHTLLDLYITQGLSQKALRLWEVLQEEQEIPTPEFLNKLGNHLILKGIEVPFEIPKTKSIKRQEKKKTKQEEFNRVNAILTELNHNNSEKIVTAFQKLSETDLTDVVNEIVGRRNFYNLLNALGEAGEADGLAKINSMLPEKQQNQLHFKNCYAKACGKSKRADQWLDEWMDKVNQVSAKSDLEQLSRNFPTYGFCSLINDNPKLMTKCEELAQKYADRDILTPMNAIWCNAVIKRNKETGQRIWEKFIKNNAYINYRPITERAFLDNNATILYDLLEYMATSSASKNVLNGVKASLLSIYMNRKQYDDALVIATALKSDNVTISPSELKRLKIGLEVAGKVFPLDSSSPKALAGN